MPAPAISPTIVVDHDVTVIELGPGYKSVDETILDNGLRTALLEAVDSAAPPRVVLDLSQTTFFGSSFIELLFRLWNRLQGKPTGGFAICGVTSYCREVLKIAHLDTLWSLYTTRDEAVSALSSGTN